MKTQIKKIADIICPVCGYYCLGKGGFGCIDKLSLYEAIEKELKQQPSLMKKLNCKTD